jgi:hypothetical protein
MNCLTYRLLSQASNYRPQIVHSILKTIEIIEEDIFLIFLKSSATIFYSNIIF